jgi:FkbM family methyltransferase
VAAFKSGDFRTGICEIARSNKYLMVLMLTRPYFVLTVPKSGTHLIANLLRAVLDADNVFPSLLSEAYLLDNRKCLAPLVYVGHLAHSLELAGALRGAPPALLCRDPRDVVTSYCNALYHRKVPGEPLLDLIHRTGLPFSDTLSFLILGGRDQAVEQDDVKTSFTKYYLRWLQSAAVTVRYEDLLPQGDDWSIPVQTVRNLLCKLGLPFDDAVLEARIREGSDPSRSTTFHRGNTGAWRRFFTAAHTTQFKGTAGDLLVALGYETTNSWGDEGAPSRLTSPAPQSATPAAPTPAWVAAPAEIYGRLESVAGILQQLENRKDYIHNKISFLRLPYLDTAFLCYTNGSLHRQLNQTFTDHSDYRRYLEEDRPHPDPAWIREWAGTPGRQPLQDILAPRLATGANVCYIDIGCGYGMEPIVLSSLFWDCRDRFRIVGVDPGPAIKLAPFNAEINGHQDRIQFLPLVVESHLRTALVYGEYGDLGNVRTVNRFESTETFSYPCQAVTVDELVRQKGINEEIVMKIEIQGGEAEVLRGAVCTLENQCSALMLKFIPHALAPSIDPGRILSLIPTAREVYHLPYYWLAGNTDCPPVQIPLEEMAEFSRGLRSAKEDFCFLLVLLDRYFSVPDFGSETRTALPWATAMSSLGAIE